MDRIDRRGFLECMAWAGAGLLWSVGGGVRVVAARSRRRPRPKGRGRASASSRSATPTSASRRGEPGCAGHVPGRRSPGSRRCPRARPSCSTPATMTTARRRARSTRSPQALKGVEDRAHLLRAGRARCVRGRRQGIPRTATARAARRGWQSFDYQGVHFVGLVNVLKFKAGGLGNAGRGSARVAREGSRAAREQHAGRGLRARAALGGLSRSGAGSPRTASRRSPISSGSAR